MKVRDITETLSPEFTQKVGGGVLGFGGLFKGFFSTYFKRLGETLHRYCYVKRWQSQSPCVDLLREVGLKVHSRTFARLQRELKFYITVEN